MFYLLTTHHQLTYTQVGQAWPGTRPPPCRRELLPHPPRCPEANRETGLSFQTLWQASLALGGNPARCVTLGQVQPRAGRQGPVRTVGALTLASMAEMFTDVVVLISSLSRICTSFPFFSYCRR